MHVVAGKMEMRGEESTNIGRDSVSASVWKSGLMTGKKP